MRALIAAALLSCVAGCVLNPAAEYHRQYEEAALGKDAQAWMRGRLRAHPPRQTESGTVIYSFDYLANADCVQYYEAREGVIIRAWHEGKQCLILN